LPPKEKLALSMHTQHYCHCSYIPKLKKEKTVVLPLKFTTILGMYVCCQNIFLQKNHLKISFFLSFPFVILENKGLDVKCTQGAISFPVMHNVVCFHITKHETLNWILPKD
jgi:hypothetical protein